MAKALFNTLGERLLGKQFSYENSGKNLGSYLICKLMGKIIVIIDKSNPLFTSTLLNEYVNITSNSAFIRQLRYRDVQFTHDKEELLFFNKQNMSIVLPDVSSNNKNFSAALVQTYGCQMIAMSFQNFDENMKYYTKFFDDAGTAFVLRNEMYRYKPTYLPLPVKQDKCNTYAFRTTNPMGPNGPAALNIQILPDCLDSEYDASGNNIDASGNKIDASGNRI
jgi:competence transcription factor ComK